MTKRFSTNGYYIYDHFKDGEKWLVNNVEADDIVEIMNNLDCKARERSKALSTLQKEFNELKEENDQLKKGMIGVVDRYIKNVDCNPPSSTKTYMKIKGALVNIREDLRDLIGDLE